MRYLVLTIGSLLLLCAATNESQAKASEAAAAETASAEAAPAEAASDSAEAEAPAYTIEPDKVDSQKIYYGSAGSFRQPGNVDYEAIIKATPEFEELRKRRIEVGTGRYWILMSQASDRAVRAIADVGQETGYDFIAASGYLGSLDPPISADDVTPLVLAKVTGRDRRR